MFSKLVELACCIRLAILIDNKQKRKGDKIPEELLCPQINKSWSLIGSKSIVSLINVPRLNLFLVKMFRKWHLTTVSLPQTIISWNRTGSMMYHRRHNGFLQQHKCYQLWFLLHSHLCPKINCTFLDIVLVCCFAENLWVDSGFLITEGYSSEFVAGLQARMAETSLNKRVSLTALKMSILLRVTILFSFKLYKLAL